MSNVNSRRQFFRELKKIRRRTRLRTSLLGLPYAVALASDEEGRLRLGERAYQSPKTNDDQ